MKYKIYKHTTSDGKVYIGYTGMKPEYRWNNGRGYQQNEAFFAAILSEGWHNIKHEILEEVNSLEEAIEKEKEYILQYKSHLPTCGYNTQAPTKKNTLKKVFVCDETGEVFYNLKSAAASLDVCVSAISKSIARGGACKGYHWYVDFIEI